MSKVRQSITRVVEAFHTLGFSLIVASVVYFILGSVARLVGSTMLDWTFCGSVKRVGGPDWCGVEPHTGAVWFDHFFNRLLNEPLPWFMIFWGFILVGICLVLLQALGYKYTPPTTKRKEKA